MKLSELPPDLGISVERDADFENLGFLFDQLPGKLVFAESARFRTQVARCAGVRCVIASEELATSFPDIAGLAISAEPRAAFFRLQDYLVGRTGFYGAECANRIDPSARIHPRAVIAGHGISIGPGAEIGANAVIEARAVIGAGVRIHPGAVIGGEGFQTMRQGGVLRQMRHAGGVVIGEGCEILANAVVARAVFRQQTAIGAGSLLGNGCFVSHNVQIGARCHVGHNAVVNGNTVIGDDCWIGPNACVANLLTIGAGARITMGAAVIRSLPAGAHVTGLTAIEHRRMLRHAASIR